MSESLILLYTLALRSQQWADDVFKLRRVVKDKSRSHFWHAFLFLFHIFSTSGLESGRSLEFCQWRSVRSVRFCHSKVCSNPVETTPVMMMMMMMKKGNVILFGQPHSWFIQCITRIVVQGLLAVSSALFSLWNCCIQRSAPVQISVMITLWPACLSP